MNYKYIFEDKFNFFNKYTMLFIIILIILTLFDYFTTLKGVISHYAHESNPALIYIVQNPFLFGLLKISSIIFIIIFIKFIHDILHENDKPRNIFTSNKHIKFCTYFQFISSISVLSNIVLKNLLVLIL
jgi:hypothetical protein